MENLFANLAIHHSNEQQGTITMEYQEQLSIGELEVDPNCNIEIDEKDWRIPILKYLRHQAQPSDKREAHKLQARASRLLIVYAKR